VLGPHKLKAAAMALLCHDNGSITLPWQWHYYAMAMALLCHGNGISRVKWGHIVAKNNIRQVTINWQQLQH